MVRTFKAADGRRVTARMSAEQIADREMLDMAVFIMPVAVILAFAVASGLI